MSDDSSVALQLTRTRLHFTIQCNPSGCLLAHWFHLHPDRTLHAQLERSLLHQMNRLGPLRPTGIFYTGGIHTPHLFLFELTSDHLSFTGHPCTPEQAEQRFQSCTVPDLSAVQKYTAVLLHRPGAVYCPDPGQPLSSGGRHLLRQCLCMEGPDFADICFRRGNPVQWFRLWRRGHRLQCDKLHLIPLCTAHRQALLLCHALAPDELIHSYCPLPAPEETPLTPREQQVLNLAGQGLPNRAIAALLRIQEGTVKKLLSGVYAKLGLHSRYDLLRRNISV